MQSAPDPAAATPQIPAIDFRAALNDDQYAAVTAPPGPVLVLAGAGSGKTRTLTYRVAWLLSQGVHPWNILLLTFTNKAAREMLGRVEELTGVDRARFWGGTFHHVGHRILRTHGEAIGLSRSFTILDEGDAEAFLRDVVERVDPGFFKDKTRPRPGPLGDIISLSRNTCRPVADTLADHFPQHETLADRITAFAAAYHDGKRRQQVCDYDDLLELWLQLLTAHPQIADDYRHRFRHCLVDEYQDTNLLQARIVDTMASDHRVMAVGDDAQCIYSWRGANFDNFATFPDRHPGTRLCRIEINYRSTPEILALANGVLVHQVEKRGFEKSLRASRGRGERPLFVRPMSARDQASFIIKRLRALLDDGRRLSDIAVLYRAHFQALELQLELSRLGVPFQITSGIRFFEQAHIRDLVALLRFIHNAADVTAWSRLVQLLPKVGEKGAARIHARAAEVARANDINFVSALFSDTVIEKVPKDARADWESFSESLREVASTARTGKPPEIIKIAIEGWYGDYLRGAYANYQNRLEDLDSLVGFAGRFDDFGDLLAQITLLTSETSDRGVEQREDALRLTTVHQAKGLEFDVVFVIGLAESQFPLRRAVESGDVEEERRLFYVAVTRAREELVLCAPRMSERPPQLLQPSRFIAEIDPRLYDELRLQSAPGW